MFGDLVAIGAQGEWQTTNSVWNIIADHQRVRHAAATANFRRIHGHDPHPMMNLEPFLREYAYIPSFAELAWRTERLGKRIDAAKAKHGVA